MNAPTTRLTSPACSGILFAIIIYSGAGGHAMKDYLSKIAERVFGQNDRISGQQTGFEGDRAVPPSPGRRGKIGTGDMDPPGIGYLPGDINEKMRRHQGPVADIDADNTPLHRAARNGHTDKGHIDAAKMLAQGPAVAVEIQQHGISTAQANRTKQLFLTRKRGPRR